MTPAVLAGLISDATVDEILVVRFDRVFVERSGKLEPVTETFESEEQLVATIQRLAAGVGRRVDLSSPMVDARLSDGSRLNAVLPPLAVDGATLSIRKFARSVRSVADLQRLGTLSKRQAEYLNSAVAGRLNILISGGTGSGKTTTLNALSGLMHPQERIVSIEDVAELQLTNEHLVRLETRTPNSEGRGEVTMRQLVRNAMRMRPDRIVVGEVRDGVAFDLLQAMNTGHSGCATTIHANSATDALSRLETLALLAGVDLPLAVIRTQVARAIQLVIHQERLSDGSRRVTQICEVEQAASGELVAMEMDCG